MTPEKPSNSKPQRHRLAEDNAFITNILSLIHIPKHRQHGDSDEEDVGDVPLEIKKNVYKNGANRVTDINVLRQRLKDKMETFKNGEDGTKNSKMNKKERKEKAREDRKAAAKLARLKELNSAAKRDSPSSTEMSSDPPLSKKMKPVYNSEGKVVYSKFDFTEMNGNRITGEESKKKKTLDPKAALRKLTAQKEKLQSLKEKGKEDRAKEIEEDAVWEAAIGKAEGVKVKDDETLLKKSVKKIDSRKKATKRKWDKHVDEEDRRKDAHQKKRTENIQKRKKEKKDRKMKKAGKRGRSVPGFT